MVEATAINDFLDKHLLELVIGGGAIFGFIVLYKKMRNVPAQPDFIRVFNERNIQDESLNVRDKLSAKWLYRGEERIGRIINDDLKHYSNTPTKEEVDTKAGTKGWETDVHTIVFRTKDFLGQWFLGKKHILRFKEGEARYEGSKLVFPSDMGFTALGNEYMTKTSFKEISTIIEAEWSKRLLEANVNVMASKMSHISAETPEMAHELSLKRLEIEKIRAEKQSKVGGLI